MELPQRERIVPRVITRFSPDGAHFIVFCRNATAGTAKLSLHDVKTRELIQEVQPVQQNTDKSIEAFVAAFSDGTIALATQSAEIFVAEFNWKQLPTHFSPIPPPDEQERDPHVWDLKLSQKGDKGALGGIFHDSRKPVLYLFDSESRSIKSIAGGIPVKTTVSSLAFHPKDSYLAIGNDNKSIYLYHLDSKTLEDTELGGHSRTVVAMAFDQDGTKLASSATNRISVWNWSKRSGQTTSGLTGWTS